ncbi:MAG: DNA polymerase IV [Deltaproteobacteria bacterium]|nr:DNA polymerase IV [Deltaproteobacteria bacterium]
MPADKKKRAILHLDMDAFYASVEVLDEPMLRGKPVIVGGSSKRGVVSSASYVARQYGIHSAQPLATARHLCPHGIFLPVRMARYKEVSRRIFTIFSQYTPLVEPVSIDEAFLDVTASRRLFGSAVEIAQMIKKRVRQEIGLTLSAGIAPCKLAAKIASDLQKPDGLTIVPHDGVREFLRPLPIDKLWGVGRETSRTLAALGVSTIGDLALLPRKLLCSKLGAHGLQLHQLANGVDDREVKPGSRAKSVGREKTYDTDITDVQSARKELLSLAYMVARKLRQQHVWGSTITLKVKYGNFQQITRSLTLEKPTDDGREIFRNCCLLMDRCDIGSRPVRLLGVSVSQLRQAGGQEQLPLFHTECDSEKRQRLNRALDKISEKYGDEAILPATLTDSRR